MLGTFDNIAIGTKLRMDKKPGTIYSVSDFGTEYADGRLITTLILNKLDADGYRACRFDSNGYKIFSRKVTLPDTPANRAAWSRV